MNVSDVSESALKHAGCRPMARQTSVLVMGRRAISLSIYRRFRNCIVDDSVFKSKQGKLSYLNILVIFVHSTREMCETRYKR